MVSQEFGRGNKTEFLKNMLHNRPGHDDHDIIPAVQPATDLGLGIALTPYEGEDIVEIDAVAGI